MIAKIRNQYHLKPRYDRLREAGLLTVEEMATLLGTSVATVKQWGAHGLLRRHPYTEKNESLYEHPGNDMPTKCQGRRTIGAQSAVFNFLLLIFKENPAPTAIQHPR